MNKEQYENKLQLRGCHKLGGGLYSNVFAFGPDKAIKVAHMDKWPEYIYWATVNGHAGGFAPKVYSLKFHDDFYVAIMERLVCTIGQIANASWDNNYPGHKTDHVVDFKALNRWDEDDCQATDLVAYLDLLRGARLCNDLHDGNVMLRKDGQMVVIDPTSSNHEGSRYRIKHGTAACL